MGNRPIKKWRSGNFEAAIWLNEKKVGDITTEFKTASLSRSWKKKEDDTWRRDVIHFRRMDLPKMITLLTKVQEELYLVSDHKEEEDE